MGAREEAGWHAVVVVVRRSVMVGVVVLFAVGVVLADWDPWNLTIFERTLWDRFVTPPCGAALAVTPAVLEGVLSFRHRLLRRFSCAVLAFICIVGAPTAVALSYLPIPRAGFGYWDEALAISPDGRVSAIVVREVPYDGSTDAYFRLGLYTTAGLDRAKVVDERYNSVWELKALDLHFTDNRTLRIGVPNQWLESHYFRWVRFDKNLNVKDTTDRDG